MQKETNQFSLIENENGSTILEIPEGVVYIDYQVLTALTCRELRTATKLVIPSSVEKIADVFWHFENLEEIVVSPHNKHFLIEDGILFSADKKKIIKYLRNRPGETYHMDDSVEEICPGCFNIVDNLKNLYIGKNVRKIGNDSLGNEFAFSFSQIYIPPTVTSLEGEIFSSGMDDGGYYYPVEIVGGASGSVIEEFCNQRNIHFIAIGENEVENFYAMSVDQLRQQLKKQIESEVSYFVDMSDHGYRAKLVGDTLTYFVPDTVTRADIALCDISHKLSWHRKQKVKHIVVGERITSVESNAWRYPNLESIHIGSDVKHIDPECFYAERHLKEITVDAGNSFYRATENILYSYDLKTLVKYPPSKPGESFVVPEQVTHIENCAFIENRYLQCLKVGSSVVSIGKMAFMNTKMLRHVYIDRSVTALEEDLFIIAYGWELPCYSRELVVGGPSGSTIEEYCCSKMNLQFTVIEEAEIDDYLKIPLPPLDMGSCGEDKYLAKAQKEAEQRKQELLSKIMKLTSTDVLF